MLCEYCGKSIKTVSGLAKHMRASKYCIGIKHRREAAAANSAVGTRASGEDKFGLGKRKVDLEEEERFKATLKDEDGIGQGYNAKACKGCPW
jgi:hypothetical protein